MEFSQIVVSKMRQSMSDFWYSAPRTAKSQFPGVVSLMGIFTKAFD
jgi:hypothetical protein